MMRALLRLLRLLLRTLIVASQEETAKSAEKNDSKRTPVVASDDSSANSNSSNSDFSSTSSSSSSSCSPASAEKPQAKSEAKGKGSKKKDMESELSYFDDQGVWLSPRMACPGLSLRFLFRFCDQEILSQSWSHCFCSCCSCHLAQLALCDQFSKKPPTFELVH
jgi:hypothetical protein